MNGGNSISGHTPGPWRVLDDHPDRACLHVSAADQEYPGLEIEVATVFSHNDKFEANARLIAAAPTMLAKLKELRAECGDCYGKSDTCTCCADIREVIDEAEGRSRE